MTQKREAPNSWAASTYCSEAKPSVSARAMRKKRGASSTPTAMTTAPVPLEKSPVAATAKTMIGSVSSESMKRMTKNSEVRPRKAEMIPGSDPEQEAERDRGEEPRIVDPGPGDQPAEGVAAEVVGAQQVARGAGP